MNDISVKTMIDEYLSWYKSKTTFKQLEKAEVMITPFVNHLNDRISIFVEILDDGRIRLSDDGDTLNELSLMNIDLTNKTRSKIIKDTIKNFNVELNGEILSVVAKNIKDFAQQKHNLLQTILILNDLLFTQTSNVKSLFKEEVLNFLYDYEFGGNVAPKFQGESGIIHSVDYSLGATKKRPNILFRFQNNPDFSNVAAQKFIADDLAKESNLSANGFKFIMITGQDKYSPKVEQAAEYSNIELVPFTNKKQLLQLK